MLLYLDSEFSLQWWDGAREVKVEEVVRSYHVNVELIIITHSQQQPHDNTSLYERT